MISDVANWVLINVLTNTRVLTSLLALIILIVAGFLISDKKPAEKIPFRRVLGAVLFVFGIFIFLYANIADLADVFIAWATLVLAGVAVFSFEESRRLREQYKKREEHDRKERLLNEIIEWGLDINKSILRPIGDASTSSEFLIVSSTSLLLTYGIPFIKNEYLRSIANSIGNTELQDNIESTIKAFTCFLFLQGYLHNASTSDLKEKLGKNSLSSIEEVEGKISKKLVKNVWDMKTEYELTLMNSVQELLVTVSNIKASLLVSSND